MFGLSRPTDALNVELSQQVKRSGAFFHGLTASMIENGILNGDPVHLGHMFWAGMHGVIVLHLTNKLDTDVDAKALLMSMLQTLSQGAKGPAYDAAVAQFIDKSFIGANI